MTRPTPKRQAERLSILSESASKTSAPPRGEGAGEPGARPAGMPSPLATTLLLGLLVSFAPMSIDLYLPAFPAMTAYFGTDVARIQMTLSVYMVGFAIAQTIFGPISDRFGRKPTILAGTALYAVTSVACALATSVDQLIVFRLLQALGAAAAPVVARAVIRDLFTREEAARMFAMVMTVTALAPVVAPIAGGYIILWLDWQANFWVLTAFGVAAMALVATILPETNRFKDPGATRIAQMVVNFATMLGRREYVGYLMTVMGSFGGLFAYLIGSSFVLVEAIGLSPDIYGWSFGGASIGFMFGAFLGSRLVRQFGVERMCLGGTFCTAAAGLLVFALIWTGTVTAAAVIGPAVLYFFGMGLSQPNVQSGAISPFPRMAGTAAALLGLAQYISAGILQVVLGQYDFDPTLAMSAVMGGAGLFAFVSFTTMVWLPMRRASRAPLQGAG